MSRKNLSFIQFVSAEATACIDVLHAAHERIETLGVSGALRKLREPFAESIVERSALAAGDQARPFDQIFVGAHGDVLHTEIVYTNFVRNAR